MIEKGKKTVGGILPAVLAWLVTALGLLLVGAAAVSRTELRQESLVWISAFIVFASSAVAAWFCTRESREGKRRKTGLPAGLVCAVVLLMTGFIVDSDKLTITGLARVVLSSVAGAVLGASSNSKPGRSASGRKISARKKTGR